MSHAQWESMQMHVQATFPREACGVLAGEQGCVRWVESITNVEDSPNRFRMDPQEQLNVMLRIEDEGLELIGIYHSHPKGPDELSESDIQEAAYHEAANLVWFPSGKKWSCKAFIIKHLEVREIPIHITGSGTQTM